MFALVFAQVLLSVTIDGDGPVRFGVPLPAAALQRGLRADGGAALQWRPLHERPDPRTQRLWVEVAVAGGRGRLEIAAGGVGPAPESGAVVTRTRETFARPGAEVERTTWRWSTGEVDVLERQRLTVAAALGGEDFAAEETLTSVSTGFDERWLRVHAEPEFWANAGVLPAHGRLGQQFRERLARLSERLPELPGVRGRGDYGRSRGVVTNLEYDTALGFARLGLALGRRDLLARALASSRHTIDHDLDRRQGLPFRHGTDHRDAAPEPGHVWLTGLLLVGCLTADAALLGAARGMAMGLARHPPQGQGRDDLVRDSAWPLLELESWLRFEDQPGVQRAADALAFDLLRRFDARNRVVRFGEGECRGGAYEECTWVTAGIVVPALRAHLQRRPDSAGRSVLDALERRTLVRVTSGREGLPLREWLRDGAVLSQVRGRGTADAFLLVEGVPDDAIARCLARREVQRSLRDTPAADDPDLATAWSIAARCAWIHH